MQAATASALLTASVAAQPGTASDLSPHIDLGVNSDTGQVAFAYTGINADTPIVIDLFTQGLPGGGGGFVSVPFSRTEDLAYRTASQSIAADAGFTTFSAFSGSSPQVLLEAVALDPLFQAFVFGSSAVDAPGDGLVLNAPGQSIDVHPTYIVGPVERTFIGRTEATFRFVPIGAGATYQTSESFRLILVVGGDYDADARLTATDIDLLSEAVRDNAIDLDFDLNRNLFVEEEDRRVWVEVLSDTRFGDADLDGAVNLADFAALAVSFGAADAGWASGDFTGDGAANLGDFASLGRNFGFNRGALADFATGPRTSGVEAARLPEPGSAALLAAAPALLRRRR